MHNLVSNRRCRRQHRSEPGQRLGAGRRPTSPWWVTDNGTDVSTLYNAAGTPLPLVVDVPGAPTGTVFNGTPGELPRRRASRARRSSSPPRAARSSAGTADRPATVRGRPIAGRRASTRASRSRRRRRGPDLRHRLPQRRRRRLRLRWQPVRTPGVRRPVPAAPVRAVRDPDDRRPDLRHLRQAASRQRRRGAGQGPGHRRCVRHRGPPVRPRRPVRRPERPLGPRRAPTGFGRFSRRSARRQLRRRHVSTPITRSSTALRVPPANCARATASPLAIDGLWALEFGHGRDRTTAPPTRCSSPPDPTTRRTACSAPFVRPRP